MKGISSQMDDAMCFFFTVPSLMNKKAHRREQSAIEIEEIPSGDKHEKSSVFDASGMNKKLNPTR